MFTCGGLKSLTRRAVSADPNRMALCLPFLTHDPVTTQCCLNELSIYGIYIYFSMSIMETLELDKMRQFGFSRCGPFAKDRDQRHFVVVVMLL